MDIFENPFSILGVSPLDDKQCIMDAAEEKSLTLDPDLIRNARVTLASPRKRLEAEVAWLPGVEPNVVREMISQLESEPSIAINIRCNSPMAEANLIVAALRRLPNLQPNDLRDWTLKIAELVEVVDPEVLRQTINRQREKSGFPKLTELKQLKEEVDFQKRHLCKSIKEAFNQLNSRTLVDIITTIVDTSTNEGEQSGPRLIDDLINSYEIEAQAFLEKEKENIEELVKRAKTIVASDQARTKIQPIIDQLIKVLHNWDSVAQPIQVNFKSRSIPHDASYEIASIVRDLSIHVFNEYQELEISQQLNSAIQEAFLEVERIVVEAKQDAESIKGVIEQRKNKGSEWATSITYEAQVGMIFQKTLRISPEGIQWKNTKWRLEEITRVAWGGTRKIVNGVHTGTVYKICLGDNRSITSINLVKQVVFSEFISRLWKAVCVRILIEYMNGLKEGREYAIGKAILRDQGIVLARKNLFGAGAPVFCKWSEIGIGNLEGVFHVAKLDEPKVKSTFCYQTEFNVHILEFALGLVLKKGVSRLSSIFE